MTMQQDASIVMKTPDSIWNVTNWNPLSNQIHHLERDLSSPIFYVIYTKDDLFLDIRLQHMLVVTVIWLINFRT